MNKNIVKKFGIILMVAPFLVACDTSSYSVYPSSNPSYSSPDFDFNPIFGTKRKLAEYRVEREFEHVDEGMFDGTLLNPRNYPEDTTVVPHYRPEVDEEQTSSTLEPIDYSDELITFRSFDSILSDTIAGLSLGELSDTQIDALLSVLDGNDDYINKQTTTYYETILHNDFLNDAYNGYNNSHKIETKQLVRYDDAIVHGTGSGIIYYQDGFNHEYTLVEQIRATGFLIYEMRDETFPSGSTSARDYKRTSTRVAGNYQAALGLGGGARMKRFLQRRYEEYSQFTDPESETYSPYYSYSITGEKTEQMTTIAFDLHIDQHVSSEPKDVYEMDLHYEISIVDGLIVSEHSSQVFWANLS
ncbi:MAG TPA: hypothetical protein PK340_01015 [Bacilli bacterium]|nr:hypothetical protein [Bacilli bacterium]